MRGLIQLALGFYFRRIEKFHRERIPATGPVLFVSNHPSSLNDSFIIGTSVHRKVNFIGTVLLFRFAPLKWLFLNCGVIPVNRAQDNAKAMRSVMDTFESVFRALERGEAVAIFPEGITHDDPQLKEVKSGAARMALELEYRHGGKLGLKIVPVGLTYSAKEIYRSQALVNFGEPICASEFLAGYDGESRKDCIRKLTHEIETRIQNLILHLPRLENQRVVEAVKSLYLERLRIGNRIIREPVSRQAGDLLLTQAIAKAVEIAFSEYPERAKTFVAKLDSYERRLKKLKISDDALAEFPDKKHLPLEFVAMFSRHRRGAGGRLRLDSSFHSRSHRALGRHAHRKIQTQSANAARQNDRRPRRLRSVLRDLHCHFLSFLRMAVDVVVCAVAARDGTDCLLLYPKLAKARRGDPQHGDLVSRAAGREMVAQNSFGIDCGD